MADWRSPRSESRGRSRRHRTESSGRRNKFRRPSVASRPAGLVTRNRDPVALPPKPHRAPGRESLSSRQRQLASAATSPDRANSGPRATPEGTESSSPDAKPVGHMNPHPRERSGRSEHLGKIPLLSHRRDGEAPRRSFPPHREAVLGRPRVHEHFDDQPGVVHPGIELAELLSGH
jgi:hypothetical protein